MSRPVYLALMKDGRRLPDPVRGEGMADALLAALDTIGYSVVELTKSGAYASAKREGGRLYVSPRSRS